MKNRRPGLRICVFISFTLMFVFVPGYRAAGAQDNGIHLAEGGSPSAVIVIADDATVSAQFAAGELRHHVELITGASLPVVTESEYEGGPKVLVGESGFTRGMGLYNDDFENQEYVIKFLPGTIVLMGRDVDIRRPLNYEDEAPGLYSGSGRYTINWNEELATCYAVYDFLERHCGVRWYLPTRVGKVFPEKETLYVSGEDIRRAPAMKYRCLHRGSQIPVSLTDYPDPERNLIPERERQLYLLRSRLTDIEPYAVTHAFNRYYREYLAKHPEWFAQGYDDDLPGGQIEEWMRDWPGISAPMRYYPNMCYTNEEFIEHVVKTARDYFDTGRYSPTINAWFARGDFFSVGPMDSRGQDRMCQCPECQELLHDKQTMPSREWRDYWFFWDDEYSDYIFRFTNEVARRIAKTHPDRYVTQIAYHQNYYPPTLEPVEPNVAVSYCIHAQLRVVPAMERGVRDLLDLWDESAPESPKYLWLYFHRPGRADPFFPGFCARDIVRQMEDYHRRGIKGIFGEPTYMRPAEGGQYLRQSQRAPIVNMLEIYLAFKLADNPELCGHEMIDEFFELYYGAAGPAMQELYESIEGVYSDPANYEFDSRYLGYQTEDIAWGVLGTPERMEEFGTLMERAKAAAETPMEKKRVGLFEESVWKRMAAASDRHAENLLSNGSFERTGHRAYEAQLSERGFDPGPREEWPRNWILNPSSMGPARVRMVVSEDAPDGERYMRVDNVERGRAEVFQNVFLNAAAVYRWSLWARGGRTDGRDAAPELRLLTYDSGRSETDARTSLRGGARAAAPTLELTGEWKRYEGELRVDREGAVDFRIVLGFTPGSSVDVDDVVVVRRAAMDAMERRTEGE